MNRRRGRNLFLVWVPVLALFFISWADFARAALSNPVSKETVPLRIFYYREGKKARDSFFSNHKSIDVLAPQAYGVTRDGLLEGSVNEDILKFTRANGIKVMPLLVNKSFSTTTAARFLNNASMQDGLIDILIREARSKGYWGWQLDFEQMDAFLFRDSYSYFVERAYRAFKNQGLVLSVAVVAQNSPDPKFYPRNLWQRVIGVYDYGALAKNSDFISIMTYDDPFSKGPVSGLPWVKGVLSYALNYIPPDKISLGVPFYYWEWDDARQKLIEIGGYRGMLETVSALKKVEKSFSPKEQVAFMRYKRNGRSFTLWHENEKSMREKIKLVGQYGLHGFSAWALGLENPEVYKAFSR